MTKRLSYLLAFIKFTHIMDFMIMMPLGPQLERLWEISPQEFGLLVAAYTFSAGIVGLLGSFFVDRFDRKYALIFLYVGFLVGTFACALSGSYETLLIARCATGAFGGLLGATVLSIVGDLTTPKNRSETMGIIMAAFSAASVFGVPFGLFLADKLSWQAPFLFLGVVGIPVLVLNVLMLPSVSDHLGKERPKPLALLKEMLGKSNALSAHVFIVLLMLGQFSVITFIAPYMVSNVGFTEGELAYIYLAGGFVTFFSSPWFGKLADRFGQYRFFTVATLLSLIPLWGITNLPRMNLYAVIVITSCMFILISGRIIPAMTMITSSVSPERRGGFMSINSAIQQLGAGIASYVAGLIVIKTASGEYQDYNMVGYLAITASLIAILVAKRLKVVS
ncbi:MAG: MFS transporter [Flavobacteriales bacterium]|nr:MFS transporter [Flavobacteriales bacterium]MCB9190212.1 MFS transporter [Flavobacteriales bacterium]